MDQENRVVVLIDMDCFYCQVEEKLDPKLKGKPIAVVQYNPFRGGGIIAVNYVARARGVTRHMRGDEARKKCPEIQLPSVPCQRGKADISKYRDAGKEVARVLQKFTPLLERASIDEAYLDITSSVQERLKTLNVNAIGVDMTPNTYALGYDGMEQFMAEVQMYGGDSIEFDFEHARRLLIGAVVVSEIRAAVYQETGYSCSAGIAHNKILAKLVCGMNKPNKQTVLPKHSIDILYKTLSVKKVKHLGGKFGDTVCDILKISHMADLQRFSEKELQTKFDEKNGTWLYNIARGIDLEPVQARFNPKSIGCCKQLRGKSSLRDLDSLRKWLKDLGDEIEDRLEKDSLENNRTPKQMVVSFSTKLPKGRDTSSSRSYNFVPDDDLCGELFAAKALELVMDTTEGVKVKDDESNRKLKAPITFLGISVGKFEDIIESKKTNKIIDYFGAGSSNVTKVKDNVKQKESKDMITEKRDNKNGKDYILNKYFQATEKVSVSKGNVKDETSQTSNGIKNERNVPKTEVVLESPLDKQESFFAKLLDKKGNINGNSESLKPMNEGIKDTPKPTTPVCEIIDRGEDSNDTDFSGSTINMEINKSIALFDEDPNDVSRVSGMRELLSKSTANNDETDEMLQLGGDKSEKNVTEVNEVTERDPSPKIETFECSECGKAISIDMFETHADYHLALRLREEERARVRNEKVVTKKVSPKATVKKKVEKAAHKRKSDINSSIASFFTKVDNTIPTEVCSECRNKIPIAKFAEHLDFHEAQKLNRELNKKAPSYFTGSSVKRKNSVSPVKKSKLPCHSQSID